MAELGDEYGTVPAGTPAQPDGGLTGEWRRWMSEPSNRAAMLQMGLQLMQPLAPGQSTAGGFAQGVGAGGEASTRVQANERADLEQARRLEDTASRGELREAQAVTGAARADSARVAAEANLMNAQSKASMLSMQKALLDSRIREADTRIELNLEKIRRNAEDAPAKQALAAAQADRERARAELLRVQAGLAPEETAIRRQGANTRQQGVQQQGALTERRIGAQERGLGVAEDRVAASRERTAQQQEAVMRRGYEEYKKQGQLQRGFKPLLFEEWAEQNKGRFRPRPTPAPRNVGDRAVNDDGDELEWNGRAWVPANGR